MFVYEKNTKKHPSTLAALMTSTTKQTADYNFLATSLKDFGVKTLTYGTDGECALEQGFENKFSVTGLNIHLRCFDHINSDVKRELENIVSEKESEEIRCQILGKERDGVRTNGLVDLQDGEQFDKSYAEVSKSWPDQFKSWLEKTEGRVRSLKDALKVSMLKPIRTAAGLGNPPNSYLNQRVESLNNVIKEALNHQCTDQVSIHEVLLEKVFRQQEDEYKKAIFGMGEYRLSPSYKKYQVDPVKWSQKRDEQQQSYLEKVFKTVPDTESNEVVTKKLSISIEECGIEKIPAYVLSDI